MTKPAEHDVVVKVRSGPAAAAPQVAAISHQAALPQPMPGLARPVADLAAEQPASLPDGNAVTRLRRQAGRRDRGSAPDGPRPRTEPPPSRTLAELRRRAGQPARPLSAPGVLRRQVVTQLSVGGEAGDRISGVAVVGRPANTFGGSMGDHTTAFTVHVNAVQHALEGAPFAEAAARLGVLVSELRSLPGYELVGEALPPRHLKLWRAALATLNEAAGGLAAPGRRDPVGLIQQYVGAYLELRELVPLSTVNTGTVSKATSGKGKGEAVDALRKQAAGAGQEPAALAREILGLFDVRAAALACAETDQARLTALAPGLSAKLTPRDRGQRILLQHLRSIQTGYPGALAALAGEPVATLSSGSGDSPAVIAARQRAAAQAADDKVLGRLIDEMLSNHVMPRMVTALLAELTLLQASVARDVEKLDTYRLVGNRNLDQGKNTKKAKVEKQRITDQMTLTGERIGQIKAILGTESTYSAKSSPKSTQLSSGGGGSSASAGPSGEQPSGRDEAALLEPDSPQAPVHEGGGKRARTEPPGPSRPSARAEWDSRVFESGARGGSGPASVDSGAGDGVAALDTGSEGGAGSKRRRDEPDEAPAEEAEAESDKRARVGSKSESRAVVTGESGSLSPAIPVFGGDPAPEPKPELPATAAPKARQTIQVVLDEEGGITEVRAAGRPASPFSGTMGAHTTSWVVHLDRVRALLVGKSVAEALRAVDGPLRAEREANAEALGEVFRFRAPRPAPAAAGSGAATLSRLQDAIVWHLDQVNSTPGVTLPSADTGGKNEAGHRRVLQSPAKHSKRAVELAVLGLLDLASLANGVAKTELAVGVKAELVVVRQHLASIAIAYPGALAKAGLDPDSGATVGRIAKAVLGRDPAEKPGKPRVRKRVDEEEDAAEEAAEVDESAPLTLSDDLFGVHKPRAAPGTPAGRPEAAGPLLGSPGTLATHGAADRAAAALWLDGAGNLIEARLAEFAAAYAADIRDRGTYLAEGEGTIAAGHFRVSVRVFRDAVPPGFERRENLGGGDCLLYALHHVSQASRGVPLTALDGPGISIARDAIVAGLPAESIRVAMGAIVNDAVAQRHIAGLGTRMTALLSSPGFRHAVAYVRTARRREAEALPTPKSGAPAKPTVAKPPGPALAPAPVIRHQAVYGLGEPLTHQALLHTGGNHYVALVRAPAQVARGAQPPGSSLSTGSSSLSMALLSSRSPSTATPPERR